MTTIFIITFVVVVGLLLHPEVCGGRDVKIQLLIFCGDGAFLHAQLIIIQSPGNVLRLGVGGNHRTRNTYCPLYGDAEGERETDGRSKSESD